MNITHPHQFKLSYQGRAASVIAAQKRQGWVWGALLDDLRALESKEGSFATAELALADAKLTIKGYIDTATVMPREMA